VNFSFIDIYDLCVLYDNYYTELLSAAKILIILQAWHWQSWLYLSYIIPRNGLNFLWLHHICLSMDNSFRRIDLHLYHKGAKHCAVMP